MFTLLNQLTVMLFRIVGSSWYAGYVEVVMDTCDGFMRPNFVVCSAISLKVHIMISILANPSLHRVYFDLTGCQEET